MRLLENRRGFFQYPASSAMVKSYRLFKKAVQQGHSE